MRRFNKQSHVSIVAAGLFLGAVFTLSTSEHATAGAVVEDMVGIWTGFIQAGASPPEPMRTEVTSQENRRFTGFAQPIDAVQPVPIEGTVSASGKVNYQSLAADDHLVGKHDLLSLGGGAAILNGNLTRPSADGRFIIPCVLVMRPFAADGSVVPSLAGRYDGAISGDDGVQGRISMVLGSPRDPDRPTSFDGTIEIVIDRQTYSFQLLGTANSKGRIVAIAHQNTAGHMILNSVISNPPDPAQPASINGTFTLELGEGSELEGTFSTAFTVGTAS